MNEIDGQELAIALLRVSSDRQFQEGNGIELQKKRVDYYAEQNGIVIVRYFLEHYSGRSTSRNIFDEIIEFVRDQGGSITRLIVSDIERFTRAGTEIYLRLKKELSKYGVHLIDTSGVIQKPINTLEHLGLEYDWSVRSPSQLTEVVLADNANANATSILTRCIGGQISLMREGYQYQAPIYGFRNVKITLSDGRKVVIMEPREDEARYVRMMFRLRGEGLCADQEVCDKLNDAGYRSRTFNRYHPITREVIGKDGDKPLTPPALRRLVSRPQYCGFQFGKWTNRQLVELPYDQKLVSISQFNNANARVKIRKQASGYCLEKIPRNHDRTRNTKRFLLRHVVRCPKCGKPFVGSASKGKYNYFGYYHCSKGHKYFAIKEEEFERTVAKSVRKITYKRKWLGVLKEVAREVWLEKNQQEKETQEARQIRIEDLKAQQENLLNRIEGCESPVVRKRLEDKYESLEAIIEKLEKAAVDTQLTEQQIQAYFAFVKNHMEHPAEWLLMPAGKAKLEKIWGFIFQQMPTYVEIKNGTPQMSLIFSLLRNSEVDKNSWYTTLSSEWNSFVGHVITGLEIKADWVDQSLGDSSSSH